MKMDDLELEKAWKQRLKRKLKQAYSHIGADRDPLKISVKNNRKNPLKTSIKERIPEETLEKLFEIANQ